MAAFGKQSREVVLGGVIILGLIAFAFAVFFLEPFVASFQHNDEMIAILPEAPKLAVGAEVWIGGKRVGQVTRVAFMPFHGDSMARVAVAIQFPHAVHEFVRKNSTIRLTSARLIGAPVIDITPGTADSPLLPHGDTLYLPHIATLISLHAKATVVIGQLDTVMMEAKKLAGPLKKRMASLGPVMQNMARAQTELAAMMEEFHNGPGEFLSDGRLMGSIASLQKTAAALGPAFAAARANMSNAMGSGGASLAKLQENATRMSADIDRVSQMMAQENGTFHRMTADSALLKTLHQTKAQLDSLILEAKKHPLKFIM